MIKIEDKLPIRGYIHKKITVSYGPSLDNMEGIEFSKIKPLKDRPTPEKIKVDDKKIDLPTGILGKYMNNARIAQILAAPVCCGEGRFAKNIPAVRTKDGYKIKIKKNTGVVNEDFEKV